MQWTSILAIYLLVWVLCAFVMLPFGIRTHDELGMDKTIGQADSAPGNFRPWRVVVRATILAAVVTGVFALNYVYGWITPEDFGVYTGR